MNTTRDIALVILAGVVAVVAMGCVTVLAMNGKVEASAAITALGAPGGILAGIAIGRLSGANNPAPEAQALEPVDGP